MKKYHETNYNYLIQTDKAIHRIWCFILNAPEYFWEKDKGRLLIIKEQYNHPPLNYAGLIIFLLFYSMGELLLRSKLLTTNHTIKKQLKILNESILYNSEHELGANYEGNQIKAGIKKKKSRTIADEREIEKELQDIFNNIQKIPVFMARPEFVIVFDELDKVSPELPRKEEIIQESQTKETIFSQNSARERQAVILKLLSNMKYFLSTANAKFIFIAGREMYDMYLADIADRNNYFGSIFNDVIFVPSFLSDAKNIKKQFDITNLVEEFVCRQLIPEEYLCDEWNLKNYKKYLEVKIYSNKKNINKYKKRLLPKHYDREVNQKIQKIIAILQQFIIYLSHTSKGAPKKMIQIFESFVVDFDPHDLDERQLVVKQYRNTHFFLTFDFYDQFSVGITSYLVSPIIYRLSDANIQEHSDKLLVSTLNFVDYMLKFHSHNFSWRQLDISPEVIETNHSPELKTIINNVINLYEQIHFSKPVISLFDFKFDGLLAKEISFISKMDERFSAQFSFSLDESLALKQYYRNLLKRKQNEYKDCKNFGIEYISSISSLQIVLGDLHFLDDELEEAALYYKDGIHFLREKLNKDTNHENLELFYLYIRNQLKLAYLYEKRKQPEFAYLTYGELVKDLIEVRNFDLEKIGISVRRDTQDNKKFVMVKKSSYTSLYGRCIETPVLNNEELIYQNDRDEDKDREKKADFHSMSFHQLTPQTQQIMYKNMTFEGLQLFYLPLLAKLQILEKRYFIGILKSDIDLIEKEFDFLIRTINHKEIKILTADFYYKVGDILYYKNKIFSDVSNLGKGIQVIKISHYACYYYRKALVALVKEEQNDNEFDKKSILEILGGQADFIYEKTSVKYCNVLARVLSNMGDVFFSSKKEMCKGCQFNCENGENHCFNENSINNEYFWNHLAEFITSSSLLSLKGLLENTKSLNKIELALLLYSISMKFYQKASRYKQAAFQITKILRCFKYCFYGKKHTDNILLFCEIGNLKKITKKAINILYSANDSLNLFAILKRKVDFEQDNIQLQYIQTDSEISKIAVYEKELELRVKIEKLRIAETKGMSNIIDFRKEQLCDEINKLYLIHVISPYCINNSVHNRVSRLDFKTKLNWETFEIIKGDCCSEETDLYLKVIKSIIIVDINKWDSNNCKTRRIFDDSNFFDYHEGKNRFFYILELIISDSIFCFIDILRLIKTSGDSYIYNHRFFADTYRRLSDWVKMYEIIKLIEKEQKDKKEELDNFFKNNKIQIDKYLVKLLGEDFREQISSSYYRRKAFSHNYKSLETHICGRAYQNLLEQMYFIKGDYDDASSHFNVAIERFIINDTNRHDKFLEKLRETIEKSELHNSDNYFEEYLDST